jgi:hypothetical protein
MVIPSPTVVQVFAQPRAPLALGGHKRICERLHVPIVAPHFSGAFWRQSVLNAVLLRQVKFFRHRPSSIWV